MERPMGSARAAPPRFRSAAAWPPLVGLAVLLIVAGLGPSSVYAVSGANAAPSALLLHAEIPQALEFAAETARQRGWSTLHSGPYALTFEQAIDADSTGAPALLRIDASFVESPAGVTVTLRAQEIQSSESGTTEAHDVTQRYRENLLNALDSLAAKWGLRPIASDTAPAGPTEAEPAAGPLPGAAQPSAPVQAAPIPVVTPGPTLRTSTPSPAVQPYAPGTPVGTWAYYAERYAERQGCNLGNLGAVLEGSRDGAELHRVYCADGRQILVRCRAEICAESP